jgi:hypothetical protein
MEVNLNLEGPKVQEEWRTSEAVLVPNGGGGGKIREETLIQHSFHR